MWPWSLSNLLYWCCSCIVCGYLDLTTLRTFGKAQHKLNHTRLHQKNDQLLSNRITALEQLQGGFGRAGER